MNSGGLGGSNPFSTRQAARASTIPTREAASDDVEDDATNVASDEASNAQESSSGKHDPSAGRDDAGSERAAPPPSGREPEPRVQMNTRIYADRDRLLRAYQRQHGVTRQAVVDQMVDEYLTRRELLQ